MFEGVPRRVYDSLQAHKMAVTASAGIILMNTLAPEAGVVYANDSLKRQAELALPSAIPVAEVTGNRAVDIVSQTGFVAAALVLADHEIKRGTTTKWGLIGTVGAAQIFGCAADSTVERMGFLSPAERAQPDVGNSSILLGLLTKFALDHFSDTKKPWIKNRHPASTNNHDVPDRKPTFMPLKVAKYHQRAVAVLSQEEYGETRQRLAGAALGVLAVGLTAGAYAVEGSNGGKLDMVSHAAGIGAGALAHRLGKWFRAPAKRSDFKISRADYFKAKFSRAPA